MVLYGFCRVMAGVALVVEVCFCSLWACKLPRFVCCSCFCHSREGAKMVCSCCFCFCPSQKHFSLPRSRVYARARFNDNNNNIIDIDNRYRYKLVLACSCFVTLYQYVTANFEKQLYKALLIVFSANSDKSPFIGFK